jgi:type II secretory pathway pseudopilin PulG
MNIKEEGFTLVELLAAMGLGTVVFAALISAFLTVQSVNMLTKHRLQAVQVVRGQIELLKVTNYNLIADSVSTASYDAGPDGVFGTADDLQGTLTVTVQDVLDMDNDGNTTETSIDIDADGVNDPTVAKPIRVALTWSQYVIGQSRNFTASADTLISP